MPFLQSERLEQAIICLLYHYGILNWPFPSFKTRLKANLSSGNEFYLHENKGLFSYQWLRTWPRFETEAWGNSELAYSCTLNRQRNNKVTHVLLGFYLYFSQIPSACIPSLQENPQWCYVLSFNFKTLQAKELADWKNQGFSQVLSRRRTRSSSWNVSKEDRHSAERYVL